MIKIDQELCTGCLECADICPVWAIEGELHSPQTITINEDKCVHCGQCVQKCKSFVSAASHGAGSYEKIRGRRGLDITFKEPLFAAYNQTHLEKVRSALSDPELFTVVQCAPAVRVAIAEEFGAPYGKLAAGQMAAALRKLGFDRVYDTNYGADVTIMEEGTELIDRVMHGGRLPMFTSCCPAWVRFLEKNYPSLREHLSSCKSPQQMTGAIIKTYGARINHIDAKNIYSVSVMPCTCKSYEAGRPEMNDSGYPDVDVVITTRELARLIKENGIDLLSLEEEGFDSPLGDYSGAAEIFGVTGGVMEAAIRTGYELVTGEAIPEVEVISVRGQEEVRKAVIRIGDLSLRVGVITGLRNVIPVLEAVKSGNLDLDFIEVMTCPQGCVTGGGQPKLLMDTDMPEAVTCRIQATYTHDESLPVRKSHENDAVKKLYRDFLGEPGGEKSHKLLHTTYCGDEKKGHS